LVLFAVVVASQSAPEQRFVFDKPEVTIGRVPGNDLVLPHGNVSRRHARILVQGERFLLVDLRSTNGTYVNGRRIVAPTSIGEHDLITIGELRITIEEEEGPTTEWFPAPPLDPVEERLIAAIAARDHASRVVYADWLEGRGELARAEFLRIQDRLIGTSPDDPDFRAGAARLEELARGIDLEWRFAVGRPAIEGCLAFQLACPKEWGSLAITARDDVRFCDACERQVFYCDSIEQAQIHARLGDCVAVDPGISRTPGDLEEVDSGPVSGLMGVLLPPP
jgi:uncharacterized protein (TIGR02996 family)